ncbi:hypothetical protein IG631_14063 [Alternaria alternata]|nr:hypothetical protein IG631_14063 [Alternaria alternata]
MAQSSHHHDAAFSLRIERLVRNIGPACISIVLKRLLSLLNPVLTKLLWPAALLKEKNSDNARTSQVQQPCMRHLLGYATSLDMHQMFKQFPVFSECSHFVRV